MYTQSVNGLGEIDWSNLLKDVVGGVVAYKTADAQLDLVKAQQAQQLAQQQAQRDALAYQFNPQYSPQYGVPQSQSSNLMPILLLGGAAVALFFLMRN